MGKAIVLMLVAMFGSWWFFHAGRQMTEESVRDQYDVEAHATAKMDADYLCDRLAGDYRHESLVFALATGTERKSFGKQESCDEMREAFRVFKRLSALTNGAMGMSVENRIVEVSLSDDRKTADVEVISTIRLGGRLLGKTHGIDRLIRRNGRILHSEAKSKSWVYVPAN